MRRSYMKIRPQFVFTPAIFTPVITMLILIFFNLSSAYAAAPVVTIDLPADGSQVEFGSSVLFSATVTDPDGDTIDSYLWNSTQGNLSSSSTFTIANLSVGTHTITLVATDSNGEKGYGYVTITIEPSAPTITITSPLNGASYDYNDPLLTTSGVNVAFQATATDNQDASSAIRITWSSSLDNQFGSGSSVSPVTLSAGTHVITATATDTDGNTATDTITITIRNQPPTASISLPADNSIVAYGDLVTFVGTASDPEDGTLSGDSLVWTSSQDGQIGTGESVSIRTLKSGLHVITLTATDSAGATDTASISIVVGNAPPTAKITSPEDGASFAFGDTVVLKGTGTDYEDGTLPTESIVWTSSSSTEPLGTGLSVSVDNFPVGTHTITLTVTDSDGATDTDQIVISVGNNAPVPVITSPANNSSHSSGLPIVFAGTATDAEDGPLTGSSLVWTSDKDGIIGTGESLTISTLSINTHVITLTATDSEGVKGTASITIAVGNSAPTALITSPADNSSHGAGTAITFTGTGTDVEDGNLTGESLAWTSDRDGFMGYGTTLSLSSLSVGTHTITLKATDSNSISGTATIKITIGNSSPVALITSPADNSTHALNTTITFSGTGTDAEDGTLSGNSLKWESSINGFLGYGVSLSLNNLSVGTHTITLTATDSTGLTGIDTITITVGNSTPEALIVTPADNSTYSFGKSITFSGTGSDAEDGELSGNSLKWESSINGFLGYGKTISIDSLTVGTHTITFTATDSSKLAGTDSITVVITNTPPSSVTITSPSDGAVFQLNEYVVLKGTAQDSEDGELKDDSLVWTSNLASTPLGTGNQISINNLATGKHVITLTATDSGGLSTKTYVTITVGTAVPPSVTILSPADGSSFYIGDYIEFRGEATDTSDGAITGESLVWTSDRVTSPLGTGDLIKINSLDVGEHLITLSAKNSNGDTGMDFIFITIDNHLPVPFISAPLDGAVFDEGEEILFSGYATDEEDGKLTGNSLAWNSNIDGYLGNGVRFQKSLSYGEHTITLSAVDSNGGSSEESVQITVNPVESEPLTLEVTDISIPLGQTGSLSVSGGQPPYRYYRDYPYIASIDVQGGSITIVPRSIGKTTVRIVDHYNTTRVLNLTVTDASDRLPRAEAGDDQDAVSGSGVVLDGSRTYNGSGQIVSWSWNQTDSHRRVVLSSATSSKATFVVPTVENILSGTLSDESSAVLSFRLTVTDNSGNSSSDDININVTDNGIGGYPDGVTTFYTAEKSTTLGIKTVGDGDLVNINPRMAEFITDTANRPENMLYGLTDLSIKMDSPGASANLIIYFPNPLPDGYLAYKYSSSKGWYAYSDAVTFSSDRTKAYVILIDGSSGDDDGIADGIITDPITFGTKPETSSNPDNPSDGGGDGGGGGGCFISTLFN